MEFQLELKKSLKNNYYNDYGKENYDEVRFGDFKGKPIKIRQKIKNLIKKIISYQLNSEISLLLKRIDEYIPQLEYLYENLSIIDRKYLISVVSYRLMGYKKIKLPTNNKNYWSGLNDCQKLICSEEIIDPNFMHFKLNKLNLESVGIPIKLFFSPMGVFVAFIMEQYSYNRDQKLIQASFGDTVLDVGGCWGDTALYFAHKVGPLGKVYSFEFIPNSIKIHRLNQSLNENLSKAITLVEQPVADVSDQIIFYYDNGPGSRIETKTFEGYTGQSQTISIDDFVLKFNLDKVDFIKMDIEGAEPHALKGAINTIRRFKPKLAIATYHSWDDFVNIPKWILNLDLGYNIYFNHYTIHSEESVIFATV